MAEQPISEYPCANTGNHKVKNIEKYEKALKILKEHKCLTK